MMRSVTGKFLPLGALLFVGALSLSGCSSLTGASELTGNRSDGAGSSATSASAPSESEKCPDLADSIAADRHKSIVPNLVGQNLNNVGYWSLSGPRYIMIDYATLPLYFVTPSGEEITEANISGYKVTSQDPVGGTVFDVIYMTDDEGNEYDNLVDMTGISSITLTIEPVGN